jgi:hypothetical protein
VGWGRLAGGRATQRAGASGDPREPGNDLIRELRYAAQRAIRTNPVGRRFTYPYEIALDYPPSSCDRPRYGYGRPPHGRLNALLAEQSGAFADRIQTFAAYTDALLAIEEAADHGTEPFWCNDYLTGLDAISLYCHLRQRAPARYVEIGSGHSTTFARRAIRDGGLPTTITSIDPDPRAKIDAICDRVLRQPLEDLDLRLFTELDQGDIVFCDSSHRVFMNSDVTTFFLDVLPELPAGVFVGIHDIYLPDDYPPRWANRYRSEQYLLAALLLAEPDWLTPQLPCYFLHTHGLDKLLDPRLDDGSRLGAREPTTFWLATNDR